jgi:hypothetical protein
MSSVWGRRAEHLGQSLGAYTPAPSNSSSTRALLRRSGCNTDRSTGAHAPASAQPVRPPTGLRLCHSSTVSASGFRPVHLQGPNPRRVSGYADSQGWLPLSLPPRCRRIRTPLNLSLSQNLGALTVVWVVPLTEHELNPCIPSPRFYDACVFGVQKKGEGSLLHYSQLVLYPACSLP